MPRQVSLLETLAAAASQMAPPDKSRPTAGPPPLLFLLQALPPADHLKPQLLNLFLAKVPAESVTGNNLQKDTHPLGLCHVPRQSHCFSFGQGSENTQKTQDRPLPMGPVELAGAA